MTKSQQQFTWIKDNFQQKDYQAEIFIGFDYNKLTPICIMIDKFVDTIDLSCFDQYYKTNNQIGGRPNLDYRIMLKIYMYSLYYDISINKIHEYYALGSDLHYLSYGIHHFPKRSIFSLFLNRLDNHINDIFNSSLEYINNELELDVSILYVDGTVFEACNSRHKVVTDTNIERSNKKWAKVLNKPDSTDKEKTIAHGKIEQNAKWMEKLNDKGRTSFGRNDEDCVLLKDKNGSFIAGYNVQFVEENNYGLIVYAYISNKNPDSAVFLDMLDALIDKYKPKFLVVDTGYGTPEIIRKLKERDVTIIVQALKNKNSSKKITDYSFELSEGEDYLICPEGQMLERVQSKQANKVSFKGNNCQSCEIKNECLEKSKNKRVTIDLEEFKAVKQADMDYASEIGKELYAHRGNKCESPNGFIKYNLNGKKFKTKGLVRNNTIIKLYTILYNLRRLLSIKLQDYNNRP